MGDFTFWKDLVVETVKSPRTAAERILALDLPRTALWQMLALEIILSLMLTQLAGAITPGGTEAFMPIDMSNPIIAVVFIGAMTVFLVLLVHRIGLLFGGQGTFEGALRLVVWQQWVVLLLQAAQLLSLVLVPPLAWLIGLGSYGLTLWLLTNFIAALHGFRSRLAVFAGVLFTGMLFAFFLLFVLQLFGLLPPMEMTHV
ncbi:Yip1 family protein [Actibacterium sp.]|uniref:Yip1 family protein n=1 Tax=Actibacterium sp. TaxID=1872125 RepID=UPI00356A1478